MARLVICATPLVKIFLPQYNKLLMEQEAPDFRDTTPFSFDIVHGTAAFKVTYNKPLQITGRNDTDIESKFRWLTGGEGGREFSETDCYGLVPYEPEMDMAQRLDEMALLEVEEGEKAMKKLAKLRKDVKEDLLRTRQVAAKASEERVMRVVRLLRHNVEQVWNGYDQRGKPRPQMSPAEYLCSLVLDPQIQKIRGQAERIKAKMDDTLSTQIPG